MTSTIDDLSLIQYLDAGCFAETFLSKKKGSNQIFATKRISIKSIKEEPCVKNYIENEVIILKKIRHPNIVRLYEVKGDKNYIYLVMEFCNGGSLLKALNNYKKINGRPFTEDIVRFLMKQILSAVDCLHKNGVVHRDLNLENILLKYDYGYEPNCSNIFFSQVKIIDFNVSTRPGNYMDIQGDSTDYLTGVLASSDIEDVFSDEKTDIWCLGILCYEMLTGENPYGSGNKYKIGKNININIPKYISETAKSFLLCMIQKDSYQRLSASDLLKHKFILGNYIELSQKENKINKPFFSDINKPLYRTITQNPEDCYKHYQNKTFNFKNYKSKYNFMTNQVVKNNKPQPTFRQYKIGDSININELNIIITCCKYYYIQMKGGKSIARNASEAIKRKLGDNWLVLISDLNSGQFDFNISLGKKGNFAVFSLDNKLFQICRYN